MTENLINDWRRVEKKQNLKLSSQKHTWLGYGNDSSTLHILREPSKTTSAELLYIRCLTLHSRQALITFFAPEMGRQWGCKYRMKCKIKSNRPLHHNILLNEEKLP